MRYNISRLFGVLVGIPVAFIVWMVTVFAWDLSFLIDAIVGAGGFLLSYFPTQRLTSRKYLNEIGLSRRDYRYVRTQLNQAQLKIRTILKSFMNIRSIKILDKSMIFTVYHVLYIQVSNNVRVCFQSRGFLLFSSR